MIMIKKLLMLSLACGVAVHYDVVMAKEKDYYEVLGVTRDSTDKQIKRAFHKMAAKYHPDKNKEAGAEEKFREVAQAYEILSDQEKRKQYDQFGESAFDSNRQNHGSHFSHFNYDDILRHFHFDEPFNHGGGQPGGFQFSFGEDDNRRGFNDGFWEEDMFGDFGFGDFDTFGSQDSFFGSHYGESQRQHHSSHRHSSSHHQMRDGRSQHAHHESRASSSGGRTCKTVTQRVGNMVTTYTQCS